MEQKTTAKITTSSKVTARAKRDERLKAAMKANMARRKAQTRGRKAAAVAQDKAE